MPDVGEDADQPSADTSILFANAGAFDTWIQPPLPSERSSATSTVPPPGKGGVTHATLEAEIRAASAEDGPHFEVASVKAQRYVSDAENPAPRSTIDDPPDADASVWRMEGNGWVLI